MILLQKPSRMIGHFPRCSWFSISLHPCAQHLSLLWPPCLATHRFRWCSFNHGISSLGVEYIPRIFHIFLHGQVPSFSFHTASDAGATIRAHVISRVIMRIVNSDMRLYSLPTFCILHSASPTKSLSSGATHRVPHVTAGISRLPRIWIISPVSCPTH